MLALYDLKTTGASDLIGILGSSLKHESHAVRRAALFAIAESGVDASLLKESVLTFVDDPDVMLRCAAIEALAGLGAARSQHVDEAVNCLHNPDPTLRLTAVRAIAALGQNGAPAAASLVNCLADPDPSVRSAAARTLGSLQGVSRDVRRSIERVWGGPEGRAAAAEALRRLVEGGDEVVLRKADRYLKSADVTTINEGLSLLRTAGRNLKFLVPQLLRLVEHGDAQISDGAARTLGGWLHDTPDTGKVVHDLIALLEHRSPDVRAAAVLALGESRTLSRKHTDRIRALLSDSDTWVRQAAIRALGSLGDSRDAAGIEVFLDHKDTKIRLVAIRALSKFHPSSDRTRRIAELLAARNPSVRATAAKALATLGPAAMRHAKQVADLLLEDEPKYVHLAALDALGAFGPANKSIAENIAVFLTHPDADVRAAAATSLASTGHEQYLPQIAHGLKDPAESVRTSTATALRTYGGEPIQTRTLLLLLAPIFETTDRAAERRYVCYRLAGGSAASKLLVGSLGRTVNLPIALDAAAGTSALNALEEAWEASEGIDVVREDIERCVAEVIRRTDWTPDNLPALRRHFSRFESTVSPHLEPIERKISALEQTAWYASIVVLLCTHFVAWTLLVIAYPHSSLIREVFFWQAGVRRILGLGYVGFILCAVPALRRRLLSPFGARLVADIQQSDEDRAYFPESEVASKGSAERRAVTKALPSIAGQIVLEGASGLGKTMFLRQLVRTAVRPLAYLPAEECEHGVFQAIEARLRTVLRDRAFLRALLTKGALDLCIDGLNEVTADCRARISQCLERHPRMNIIVATQPLHWTAPATVRLYVLQPLTRDQIERFLLTREHALAPGAAVRGEKYRQACGEFLRRALDPERPKHELKAAKRVLSNPMDLMIAAQAVARGQQPNLLDLHRQQYEAMAREFEQVTLRKFPVGELSETAYQLKYRGRSAIPPDRLPEALRLLEKHKMVVRRHGLDADGGSKTTWVFRHDRIMDYFVVQTFFGRHNERQTHHLADPRFRGVYMLLADALPYEQALTLREKLSRHASKTKDHLVSDEFLELLQARSDLEEDRIRVRVGTDGLLEFDRALKVFYSYSHDDEALRKDLMDHLALLERQRVIVSWHDREISGGTEWEGEIDEHLNTADVILLLVSASFLASDYCYDRELTRAMERHETGEARVVPLILRECDWRSAPFGKLGALPQDGKPVVSWGDRDAALTDIARGLRRVAEELRGGRSL